MGWSWRGDHTRDRGWEGIGQLALEATGYLNQVAEPDRTSLVDASNRFNGMIRLAVMLTVQHRWPSGARFMFNCYKHWVQLLLRNMGSMPAIITIQKEVNK